MILLLINPALLRSCCPECFPGDIPAFLPASLDNEGNGSLLASYRCGGCGHEWTCRWDSEATGWGAGRAA